MGNLENELEYLVGAKSLLDIRGFNGGVFDDICSGRLLPSHLRTKEAVIAYFKIFLSKCGSVASYKLLDQAADYLSIDDYVWLGSYIARTVGDFDRHQKFLRMGAGRSKAWIERDLVRSLIYCGEFDLAVSRSVELLNERSDLYEEFALSILWQAGEWGFIEDWAGRGDSSAYSALRPYMIYSRDVQRCSDYCEDIKIYSIYNHYTTNQRDFQLFAASRLNISVQPVLGVSADRLPSSVLLSLGGRSPSVGIVGASLAHIRAIEDFIRSGDDIGIFTESDAFICRRMNIKRIMRLFAESGAGLMLCANRHTPLACERVSDDGVEFDYKGRASGFDGYIINREMALKIVDRFCAPFVVHIDGAVIDWVYRGLGGKIFTVSGPIFAQSVFSFFSTRIMMELRY